VILVGNVWPRTIARAIVLAVSLLGQMLLLLVVLPFLAPAFLASFVGRLWRRLELWAVYDGDVRRRDHDEWEQS